MVGNGRSKRSTRFIRWVLLTTLLLTAYSATAQSFPLSDTVTEYNHFGTYYHDRFEGRKTASGEVFDQNKFTAAHRKIKLGTMIMVTNHNTGLQVIVKVNDRCPKHGVIDMSHRAATAVGIRGCQKVTVRILPDGYEEQWAAQETMFDSVYSRLTDKPATTTEPEAQPASEKTATEKTAVEKKVPEQKTEGSAYKPTPAQGYNLILASDVTHSEAFESINKLPKAYQQKVIVETQEDSTRVKMTLDVRLPKAQASNLKAALKHSFPDIAITPCE